MTETAVKTAPVIVPLPADPWTPCDGHESPNVQAIFAITVTGGFELLFCLNCARKAGFAVDNIKTWMHRPKTQGSEN